jgi:lipid II:glycine glycyltransferase (peptidoglycan interpeptide bridge formation enzyme)
MTNKQAYYIFCKKEKEMPLFSQSWYLDAVCGDQGWDILMVTKGNEIAATMPILNKKQLGFSLSRMPLITPYLGPYFPKKFRSSKQQEKLTRALIEQLPKFDFFDQNFPPSMTNWLPFYWEGFEATVRYSFLIDLEKNVAEIFQNISSNYRNNKIAKAEKSIKIVSDRSLEEFYAVQKKTFDKQGMKVPYSFGFIKKFDVTLGKENVRKTFFAIDKKERIHSVAYLTWDEETAYFQLTGSDPNFKNSGASVFIVWHAIKYAQEVLGKKRFDFAGSVMENIAKVRQEFGAEQVPYFNLKNFGSKLLEVLYKIK